MRVDRRVTRPRRPGKTARRRRSRWEAMGSDGGRATREVCIAGEAGGEVRRTTSVQAYSHHHSSARKPCTQLTASSQPDENRKPPPQRHQPTTLRPTHGGPAWTLRLPKPQRRRRPRRPSQHQNPSRKSRRRSRRSWSRMERPRKRRRSWRKSSPR